jgi:hypothetical protein
MTKTTRSWKKEDGLMKYAVDIVSGGMMFREVRYRISNVVGRIHRVSKVIS